MKLLNFQSQNVVVDWISLNIQGLPDPLIIARCLSKHFTPHVLIDQIIFSGERLIFINLSKQENLIGVFLNQPSIV